MAVVEVAVEEIFDCWLMVVVVPVAVEEIFDC
jgi:hypothetical protein